MKKIKDVYEKFSEFYEENTDCFVVTMVTGAALYLFGVNKGCRICEKAVKRAFTEAVKHGYGLVKIIK